MSTGRTSVQPVDPRDDAAFGRWYDVVRAVRLAGRPTDLPPTLTEERAWALAGARAGSSELCEQLLVLDGDSPVAAGQVQLPQHDNRHIASLDVLVAPPARRRGVGTVLLEALIERARDHGRNVLFADVDEPPAEPGGSAGRAFAEQAGFSCALVDVRRDLALPADPDRLASADDEARSRAGAYLVRTWRDRCPDNLVDARAGLARQMSLDVPLGELDWREERWDAARVREREELVAAQGRSTLTAAALCRATGELVGFTEIAVAPARPQHAEQWETLVLTAHRGGRLGLLLKVAVLRELAAQVPQARLLVTHNAASNAPMIAVNERLGFVPNGTLSGWQRRDG